MGGRNGPPERQPESDWTRCVYRDGSATASEPLSARLHPALGIGRNGVRLKLLIATRPAANLMRPRWPTSATAAPDLWPSSPPTARKLRRSFVRTLRSFVPESTCSGTKVRRLSH